MHVVPIIVDFGNVTIRRDFLLAFRRQKLLNTADIGLNSDLDKSKIFAFEHLTAVMRKVYLNAKKFQIVNQYKYIWTRDGKIFLRRTDDSVIIRVMPHTDLAMIGNNINSEGSNRMERKDRKVGPDGVSRK